jgi:hypothetical protein
VPELFDPLLFDELLFADPLLLADPLLADPELPADPLLDEPVLDEAFEPEPPLADVDVLVSWPEPGSVAAMAPVASTLATPTPAVTTDSRFRPRRRSAAGDSGWPPGLLDIGTLRLPPAVVLATLLARVPPVAEGYLAPSSELLLSGRSRQLAPAGHGLP